ENSGWKIFRLIGEDGI
ncbi:unnamed protein product, partial [Allacma fusca]